MNVLTLLWGTATSLGRNFKATGRPSSVSCARYTSPMPPAPILETMRYRAIVAPGESSATAGVLRHRSTSVQDETAVWAEPSHHHRRRVSRSCSFTGVSGLYSPANRE